MPRFWKSFQDVVGIELKLSIVFHPQADGQSKRMLQTLEGKSRVFTVDLGGCWDDHMALVEVAYNNSYPSSIKMAPYEALYERNCRSPLHWDDIGKRGYWILN